MKRIAIDRKDKKIKDFVRALGANDDGSILELGGVPVLKALPLRKELVDTTRLRAAIRKRRDESRSLMRDWEAVDRQMWERIPIVEE